MKRRKAAATPRYRDYPKSDAYRSGCKVAWNYYRNEADAKACAEAARHNAVIKADDGYDFGYCVPGSITKMDGNGWEGVEPGMFEVCIP